MRMNGSNWLAVGLLAITSSIAGVALAAPGADETAVRALDSNWVNAYNAGDAKTVAAQYAEDAVLLPPGAPLAAGRVAILSFFTKDIAASKAAGVMLVFNPGTSVGISRDLAWASGTYRATVKDAVVETGKFMSVARKKDGKWLYLRDTWNQDSPPAPEAAPAAARK